MTKLTEILTQRGRLVSTEFLPPKGGQLSDLVNKTLKVANVVDSVSIPELKANLHGAPKFRMNPFYTALRLRDLTGVQTVFHLTPRDYNKNAVAGLVMAAAEAHLQNILVIGGDRYTEHEVITLSKNVYDYDGSTDLVKGIRGLEKEIGLGNNGFCIIVGSDPTLIYTKEKAKIEAEIIKLIQRQDAGADLVQTQPVFDMSFFEFLELARQYGLKIPVLVGILPLRGKGDCIQIERRYGILIPDDLKSSLRTEDEERGRRMACQLASDLVKNGVRCLHIYPRGDCEFVFEVVKTTFSSVSSNLN